MVLDVNSCQKQEKSLKGKKKYYIMVIGDFMKIIREKCLQGLKKEDKILLSNILDKYERYLKTGYSSTTNFLDKRKKELIKTRLSFIFPVCTFYSIDEICEKCILCIGESEKEITLYYSQSPNMRHNEILATLFQLGFEPDTIGDIWVEQDGFYLTNLTRLNTYLEDNFVLVRGKLVHLEQVAKLELKEEHFSDQQVILSSLRLDNLISKLTPTSRREALRLLETEKVLYNYEVATSPLILVKEQDVLSIRHVGKFIVTEIAGTTKKNKLIVKLKKYK